MTSPSVRLRMSGIVKRFPGVLANDGASLEVGRGEIHALLGENGAGKSTLMQVLYGMVRADTGRIELDGRPLMPASPAEAIAHGIGMVHQEFMLVPPFTVAESVLLGRRGGPLGALDLAAAEREVAAVAARHGLQVDPRARIEQLPLGVQQRVEILKLLCRDARLLILDEPTAVLTPGEIDGFFAILRTLAAEGRSIVIVTHKLHEIRAIAARVTVMRGGRTVDCLRTADVSEHELARLMVGREVALGPQFAARQPAQPSHPGAASGNGAGGTAAKASAPARLELKGLHVHGDRGQPAVRGVDLTVQAGEIVGIAGVDGNGQSELAEAVIGLRPATSGRVSVGGRDASLLAVAARRALGLAYVPADRRQVGSAVELPIRENALLGRQRAFSRLRGLWRDEPRIGAHARALVQRFGVRAASIEVPAGTLSGGNLQKLILGRELMLEPQALVVEQPTRGLDVGAVESVWQELLAARDRGTAVLLVSAELDEILALADRIGVMYGGRLLAVLANDRSPALRQRIGALMAGLEGFEEEAPAGVQGGAGGAALPPAEASVVHGPAH